MTRILIFFLFCISNQISSIVYRTALPSDMGQVANLFDKISQEEHEKLIVHPESIRRDIIRSYLESGKIFVAVDEGLVVGIKKLYITSGPDCSSILKKELRSDVPSVSAAFVQSDGRVLVSRAIANFISNPDPKFTYIYNGSDYTLPTHRRAGVNRELTSFALRHVTKHMSNGDLIKPMALCFGLAVSNSGSTILEGRSKSLLLAYLNFIREVRGCEMALRVSRYKAFMPQFEENRPRHLGELLAKPDKECISGFGYVAIEERL